RHKTVGTATHRISTRIYNTARPNPCGLRTLKPGQATHCAGGLVGVYKVVRLHVHDVIRTTVHDVPRLHTNSVDKAYHQTLRSIYPNDSGWSYFGHGSCPGQRHSKSSESFRGTKCATPATTKWTNQQSRYRTYGTSNGRCEGISS